MHEVSIALSLKEILEEEVAARSINCVKEVELEVGELSSIDPRALEDAIEVVFKDTIFSSTKFSIKTVGIKAHCNSCNKEFEVKDFNFICPFCGSSDLTLIQGEELMLKRIIVC